MLDNLADIFAGNENVRPLARQFIGALRGLAIEFDCVVLLLSHPSLSGINSGSGTSGNTAWNNSVRSRLYLTRDDEDKEVGPDRRILQTMKANYGPNGCRIELRWEVGRFARTDQRGGRQPRRCIEVATGGAGVPASAEVACDQGDKRFSPPKHLLRSCGVCHPSSIRGCLQGSAGDCNVRAAGAGSHRGGAGRATHQATALPCRTCFSGRSITTGMNLAVRVSQRSPAGLSQRFSNGYQPSKSAVPTGVCSNHI